MSGENLKCLLRFFNEYGELETAEPRIWFEAYLVAVGEASGTGGSYKVTLSSIVIFGFFWIVLVVVEVA